MSKEHVFSKVYSITVRPRRGVEESFDDIDQRFLSVIEKYDSKKPKYLYTIEKQGTTGSHIQGIIEFEQEVRQDNLRASIKKRFPPCDSQESRNMFNVVSHDDKKYLIGYCTKESKARLSNYDDVYVLECVQYYEEKEKIKKSKDIKFNKNSRRNTDIHDRVYEYWCKMEKLAESDVKITFDDVMMSMTENGVLLPSEYVKIKRFALQEFKDYANKVKWWIPSQSVGNLVEIADNNPLLEKK